jgi:F-box-like
MHLCLKIAEILTKIFSSYDGDKESIKSLYSLALVCQIFHEPARDALWRFQRSFVTLVKTFPEDLWDETEDPVIAVSLLSQY